MFCLRSKLTLAALVLAALAMVGCQTQNVPGPTPIPTERPTFSPSPSATQPTVTPSASLEPPTLRPMIMATSAVTAAPVVEALAPTATAAPLCFVAQANDSLITLAQRGGYNDLSVLPAIRELNGLCSTCSNIQVGQKYCIPNPTATPTPQGYEKTKAVQTQEVMIPTNVVAIATYVVKSGDTSMSIIANTGATIRDLCSLNDPTSFNCAGCNLDKPFGDCRPIVREGQVLKIPGPPPTATITPTLTGSETATPTPIFTMPRIISPINGTSVHGIVQLLWLPVSILQPDEFYLVLWTDATTGQTRQARTQGASFRMPVELEPTGGQAHTINWQIAVAREAPDGSYILISPLSLIYTFRWESR